MLPIFSSLLIAGVDIFEALGYQTLGMIVVFFCLGFLAAILALSGKIAEKIAAAQLRKIAVAEAEAKAKASAPVPAVKAVAQPSPEKSELARVAAVAASVYTSAQESLTPEILAVIAAVVHTECGINHRIVSITPVSGNYARSGRSEIFASHRI